ncbi:MAG: DUF1656 domain-containing protein [Alphaproteobacteria bacterium]|nr:DUF1656 domain-containing protein [Alphaproteobacteria bacterium]
MNLNPTDVDIYGVFWPPLLVVFILSLLAMHLTVYLLNRYRLSRYFMSPLLVMATITTLYVLIIGTFVIPI